MVQYISNNRPPTVPRTGCGCGGSRAPIPLQQLGLDKNLNVLGSKPIFQSHIKNYEKLDPPTYSFQNNSSFNDRAHSVITYQTKIPQNNGLNKEANMKVKESFINIRPKESLNNVTPKQQNIKPKEQNVTTREKNNKIIEYNKKEFDSFLVAFNKSSNTGRGITMENSYNKMNLPRRKCCGNK
jgi:hypothetical protein